MKKTISLIVILICLYILVGKVAIKQTVNTILKDIQTAEQVQQYSLELKADALLLAYKLSSRFKANTCVYMFDKLTERDSVIDWCVLAALIYIESNYNPTALERRTKASGWTQLLPPTAKIQAKKLGIPYHKGRTVWNEILNVELGYSYLAEGVSRSKSLTRDGKLKDALRAYVGGFGYANIKNPATAKYREWYVSRVFNEVVKLRFLYKGMSTKNK